MKRIPSILLCILLLASACKKKEVNPVATFSASQYFLPLATGNYWVYQIVDSSSSRIVQIDTIKVVSDTTINGITYYQVTGGAFFFEGIDDAYYRDSAGLVLEYGNLGTPEMITEVYKLTNHRNDTLLMANEGSAEFVRQTGNPDTTINVSAGTFSALQVINSSYYFSPSSLPPGVSNPRRTYSYFSKGIGVVFSSSFYPQSPYTVTTQLISYHIGS